MRHTSERRRQHRPHRIAFATGPSDYTRRTSRVGPVAVPADTPDATQCPDCGTWVEALTNGNPRAHAAGGYGPSVRNGRPRCPSSGDLS